MDYVSLPKIELHAHLTGSVSRQTLHDIWKRKQAAGETELEDPLTVMPDGKHDYNLQTFFPLFSSYIYNLLTDVESIRQATAAVLQAFLDDGVRYLELRTTPRDSPHLSREDYVRTICKAVSDFNQSQDRLRTRLILSVDRRHDFVTAQEVTSYAVKYKDEGVAGLDLCGDPTARPGGEVKLFTPVFEGARAAGLGITVHFAEAQASGSREELDVLLGWMPGRLGHVIWEDEEAKRVIAERGLCLELCLSCNVQAEMVSGGFKGHHFGYWKDVEGPKISLGTDDVGVFGSPLSEEYRLAAEHFGLDRAAICALARQAIDSIFGDEKDKQWLREIMWQ